MISPIHIDHIRRDGGTQMRVALREEAVTDYAERLEAGDEFPAIVVFFDGGSHWLADGFHRVDAYARLRSKHIGAEQENRWLFVPADVRNGTLNDAVRHAIGANARNGIRRTNEDKRVAVRAALAHPDMQGMSDQAIANEAGVSTFMVHQHRQSQVLENRTCTQTLDNTAKKVLERTGIDGKKYRSKVPDAPKDSGKPHGAKRERVREPEPTPRASAVSSPKKIRCPHCNGIGWINDDE